MDVALTQRPRPTEDSLLLDRAYALAAHGRQCTGEGIPLPVPLAEFRQALDVVGIRDELGCVIALEALQKADALELAQLRERMRRK